MNMKTLYVGIFDYTINTLMKVESFGLSLIDTC